jgi:hypothetical protein
MMSHQRDNWGNYTGMMRVEEEKKVEEKKKEVMVGDEEAESERGEPGWVAGTQCGCQEGVSRSPVCHATKSPGEL